MKSRRTAIKTIMVPLRMLLRISKQSKSSLLHRLGASRRREQRQRSWLQRLRRERQSQVGFGHQCSHRRHWGLFTLLFYFHPSLTSLSNRYLFYHHRPQQASRVYSTTGTFKPRSGCVESLSTAYQVAKPWACLFSALSGTVSTRAIT